MRKKDQSTEFIKMCLADALIKLMEQGDSFKEINVMDICNTAGLGRTTYYRHFDNKSGKENLILYKVYYGWAEYCKPRRAELEKSILRVLVNYIYSQKELFRLLHKNGLTMTSIFDVLYTAIGPDGLDGTDDKGDCYRRSFLACSIFGFIYYWIRMDFEDSPEYVYSLIAQVFPG